MSDAKRPMGCIGLVIIAMFLGTFAWIFFRITESDLLHEEHRVRSAQDEAVDPEFTTMEFQLVVAKEKNQKVTQIRLESTPVPLEGLWSVKEVGYDVALFDGPSGVLTLRIKKIVGIQVSPVKLPSPIGGNSEGVKVEPQLEK